MAGITESDRKHFPLKNTDAVINLFRDHLENRKEPNLALLSIVIGLLECNLTIPKAHFNRQPSDGAVEKCKESDEVISDITKCDAKIPAVQLSIVEALYEQFVTTIKGSVDLSGHSGKCSTVSVLKKVSDVIWGMLTRTFYKDKAHLQTVFSLLTESKLDGFGMAISVIAACQVLGLEDVHLALSEDHAWAVFGDASKLDSVEITWHGKGSEDKRGQSVGLCTDNSWLYTTPIVCTRQMEVAAMVTAINTAINATTDSYDVAVLQQKLLWLLYDRDHLTKYPTSLATLADMEEVNPTSGRPLPSALYAKSIESARLYYDDMHVYPYTYLGNYHYRRSEFKQALSSWARAATVISRYNYNREDEEIYKEFLEIANEMIPNMMKTVSGEQVAGVDEDPLLVVSSFASDVPLVSDPECYAFILKFYDGLCLWEEGSSTPVLHITWATHTLYSLNRFDTHARMNLMLKNDPDADNSKSNDESTLNTTARSSKAKRSLDDVSTKPRGRASRRDSDKTATDVLSSGAPEGIDDVVETEKLCLVLHSVKMMAMKDLLVAERLNSGAIKLQLTAQSQVHFNKSRNESTSNTSSFGINLQSTEGMRKRLRRD